MQKMIAVFLTIYTIVHLGWIIYCISEGKRDAYYYFLNPITYKNIPNLHKLYTIQRSCVVFAILAFSYLLCWILPLINFFILALSFSYFHNGAYFAKRNHLDHTVYPKKWKDDSTTSSALINFRYPIRLLQVIVALILFLVALVFIFVSKYYV